MRSDDRGSSIVEFAMISVLLVFLLFAVLQVAALLYVRSVVGAAASDGARYAANSGVETSAGGARATSLVAKGLGRATAADVPCASAVVGAADGLAVAQVRCAGSIHSIFLPLGAFVRVEMRGQSLKEQP